MSRLLFIVIVVAAVFWLIKSYSKRLGKEDETPGEDASGQAEDMVRCVHCGVHLPKRESVLSGGKYYCSEAHRRLHGDKSD